MSKIENPFLKEFFKTSLRVIIDKGISDKGTVFAYYSNSSDAMEKIKVAKDAALKEPASVVDGMITFGDIKLSRCHAVMFNGGCQSSNTITNGITMNKFPVIGVCLDSAVEIINNNAGVNHGWVIVVFLKKSEISEEDKDSTEKYCAQELMVACLESVTPTRLFIIGGEFYTVGGECAYAAHVMSPVAAAGASAGNCMHEYGERPSSFEL